MPTDKLLPCPFCGGENTTGVTETDRENFIYCIPCNLAFYSIILRDRDEKYKRWNTRVTTTREAELSAKLREREKPDYYYDKRNWEVTHHDLSMLEDKMACEGIDMMQIGRLAALPDKFVVQLYDEESGEAEYPEFDTLEEAEKALTDFKALPTPPKKEKNSADR